MIVRRRSRIWTQQPFGDARLELDRSNRLASTITHCLPLNGDYREIVTGNSLTLGAGASRGVDTKGISLKSSGGVACASMPMDLSPYNKLTVSFWLYWDGFANDDQLLMEHGANFVTSIGFLIDPNSSGGGFEAGVGSPGASNNWLAPRPTAAAWHHYYITIDRTTGTGQSSTICIDGVNQALTSNGASLNVDDNFRNDTLYIFSRNNSALFGAGKLQNVIFRGGYIGNPREALEEYLNPRQIYKSTKPSRRLISAGAGGSSTDLTVQEALHGHNADSLTFSMATYLSVAESLHGHAAESLTLGTTGSANLIVQEAAHAHIADGVTLTTQWLLAIAEALHSHAADNVALSLQTALSVLEALHGHSADNLTLGVTGATNLVIADATSGHAADNLAFSLNTLLAVFDAIHAHAADNLTLDTSNATALTVQDSMHAHGADSLTLSLDTWLAIVEAAHGHTADSPTLSADTSLQIAEALHAHYADVVVLGFPSAPGACPTVEEIVQAVLAALNATTIPVDTRKMNGAVILGDGSAGNKWRGNV